MSSRPERSRATALAVAALLLAAPIVVGVDVSDGGEASPAIEAEGVVVDRETPTEGGLPTDAASGEEESLENQVGQPETRLTDADSLHASGLTGEGVRVGVIGSGFETNHPAIAANVGDHRRLAGGFALQRASEHDTAVAEIVAQMAPASDLYLVGVGTTPTPERYAAAVEWLLENEVDIVVDSGSYFPSVAGDGDRIAAAATTATDRGVVFVTSAGNYAARHWTGNGTTDGWVSFGSEAEDQTNALSGGEQFSGAVSLRLRWNSSADYDLYLYRHLPGATDRVVAKSVTREAAPGLSIESVDVAVPRGRYYAAIYAARGVENTSRVQLFSARHNLTHSSPRGSMVAPATGDQVIAVGAVGLEGRRSFSSLGDRPGDVDVGAPGEFRTASTGAFSGTSAAAPYVAGTAALMHAQNVSLSPARIEAILERTAHAENDSVDPVAAVRAAVARNVTSANRTDAPTNETAGTNATARPPANGSDSTTGERPVDESDSTENGTASGQTRDETPESPPSSESETDDSAATESEEMS